MFALPKEREKREGLIGTVLFHIILLVFFLIYGLTHTVPIPETGLTVNFGTTDMGSGDNQPESATAPVEEIKEPEEEVTPPAEPQPEASVPDVTTQDVQDALEVPKTKTPAEIEAEKAAEAEAKKKAEQEEQRKKMAAIANKLNNPTTDGGGGDGPDDQPGNKGQTDGGSDGGYTGGGQGNGNYSLDGRAALTKPKPVYDCQEEGKVVVDIKVDRNGKVVYASVGKGTTNTAECLTQKALDAAYKTKWQAKNGAPIEQRGRITYDFQIH
ncbi:MAG: protein TonB [Salibacteraceae bacterium]|jgi:TonB family protein